jgi:hypothetical protein
LDLYQQLLPSEVSAQNIRCNVALHTTTETPSFEANQSSGPAEQGGVRGCI